uniref:Uncharacterized protein n=1 Tax=Palpitomonas bilix TaxID=652834 RepID=A0A7S3FZZ2_9EUKA|mmetsp:Transcript_14055/g.36101  ORF Transcript_14055/g.36101 Transcript_14055/m.36101 type:complete len:207 (+) Transcript_14055:251-871(+)
MFTDHGDVVPSLKKETEERNAAAAYLLATYFLKGYYARKMQGRGTFLIADLAKKGHPGSLGACYENGYSRYEKNHSLAVSCWNKGVEEGDVVSMFNLAQSLERTRENKRAVSLYRRAAHLNYVPAIFKLAHCYELGIGVKIQEDRAKLLYADAAAKGDPDAMYALGRLFEANYHVDNAITPGDVPFSISSYQPMQVLAVLNCGCTI